MFYLTGSKPETVSFFHCCGLDPAQLSPPVQSESKEINGLVICPSLAVICPSLAQSLLIISWMSHNKPLCFLSIQNLWDFNAMSPTFKV